MPARYVSFGWLSNKSMNFSLALDSETWLEFPSWSIFMRGVLGLKKGDCDCDCGCGCGALIPGGSW